MQRRTWVMGGAAVVALGGLLAWAFAPRAVEVEVAQATQGRFETTVDEDGRTRLRERYVVSAPLAGRLARIGLDEGDTVEAGGVVATLTPVLSPLHDDRTRRGLAARIDTAQAQVQLAGVRAERARVGLLQARHELQRSEQLAPQGFVSATKLDNDRLAVQAAQKELDGATQERRVAGFALEEARAALAASQQAPGSAQAGRGFAVRAPIAGRVLKVAQTSEGTVALGTPLVELGDMAQMEIVAELLTTDALRAAPGSRVRIERWGGAGVLEGRVRLVEPAAFTKISALGVEEQRVEVLIDITSPPEQWKALGDGYRVALRVVTLARDQVLRVPVSAVFPLPAGSGTNGDRQSPGMAVFAVESGRARLVPVKVGGRNGVDAWIESGLAPGATVIVYPPSAVKDGGRVRSRKV